MSERRVPAELRRFVADRAKRFCEYCRMQERYSSDPFAIDHINPRSRGGLTTGENLAFCCQGCNQHKSKRSEAPDPITDVPVPLFHPREQQWQEHFSWNGDFTLMVGLTPVGRATIAALHLNRTGLVNLRRALYAIGEHPPRLTEEL
jgi:hypothetical protein